MTELLLLRGADAAEDILRDVFGIRISKRKGDPLDPDGFLSFVRGLAGDLKRETANAEAQGFAEALRMLEVDWPKMTPKQREKTVRAAERAIGAIAPKVSPSIKQKLVDDGQTIIEATKRASAGKFDLSIDTALALGDERMVQSMAGMQSLFVTDEFGRRGAAVSATTRTIVSSGLARGLDQYAIGEELRLAVGAQMTGRSEAYWDVVASIFVARTRTWGQLSSFDDAGIDAWEFVAVLDEVTSEVCRLMDGKVFSVRGAMSRYQQVAASEDPEQVKVLQPFLQLGRDDQGGQYIYYRNGDRRVPVAQIDKPGMGQRDAVGSYSRMMSDAKLEAAGVGPPPLHGHCRSEIVPASLGTSAQVPRRPAAAPQALVVVQRPRPSSVPVTVVPPAPVDVVTVRPGPPAIAPPWVGGMRAGMHVNAVEGTGISAERVAEVFGAISDERLLAYLQQNPVETIVFDPDRKGSGAYKRSTKQLTLKAQRERDSYGRKFKPGESFSISKTAKTELEAIQSTLIHELGHHVHSNGSSQKLDAIIEKAFKESPSAITKYGNTEPGEYFAESFAAYYIAPKALKKHDPIGFAMIEDVLRERGIRDASAPRRRPRVVEAPRSLAGPAIGRVSGSYEEHLTQSGVTSFYFDRRVSLADIFRGDPPAVADLERTWGAAAGFEVKVTSVASEQFSGSKHLKFEGNILRDGQRVGNVTRTFIRHPDGRFEVHHDYFKVDDPKLQGGGLGEAMLRQAIQSYEQLKVDEITVDTAWVGKYTWASFGYNWNADTAERMKHSLRDYLAAYGIDRTRARDIAARASKNSWDVAALDVDGIRIATGYGPATEAPREERIGKAFLLQGSGWSGTLKLDRKDPSYHRAKERLKL